MHSQPEKSEALVIGPTRASSDVTPAIKQGFNMSDSTQVAPISATATPDLVVVDGQITTTSQQVAEHFGKRHNLVLRAIRNLLSELPQGYERNFALIQIEADLGRGRTRKDPAYRITRDGFTLLAMGFTGKEAMQWKVAYLTAFNKMEAELLAKADRPYNPAIDYDRISPAQAQDLKEIVDAIVKAGVQTYGETWKRFQHKFKVNSYLELPATRHLEARECLIAKLPKGYNGYVVEEDPRVLPMSLDDTVRLDMAFTLASQAAAQVQRVVFNGVMASNSDWKHSRFLLDVDACSQDGCIAAQAKKIESDAFVLPIGRFYAAIEDSIAVDAQALTRLVTACTARLGRMAQRAAISG